jgi:hypothetical protein
MFGQSDKVGGFANVPERGGRKRRQPRFCRFGGCVDLDENIERRESRWRNHIVQHCRQFLGSDTLDGIKVWHRFDTTVSGLSRVINKISNKQASVFALLDCNVPMKCQRICSGNYKSKDRIFESEAESQRTYLCSLFYKFLDVILPEIVLTSFITGENIRRRFVL